jgi:hypothetical protein
MTALAQLLIAAALVATAVIYGTDVFAAVVLRPALAHVDDRTLTGATGYMHDYADRRLPVPGAIGLAAMVLGTVVAALAGHTGAAVAGSAAVLAMAVWLLIYRNVSAPINRQLTAAAHDGRTPGAAAAMGPRHQRAGGAADRGRRGPLRGAHPVLTKRLAARSRVPGARAASVGFSVGLCQPISSRWPLPIIPRASLDLPASV